MPVSLVNLIKTDFFAGFMADLFYRNRRLLVLMIALIMVGGLSAFYVMPRMEDPQLVPRAANIVTRFPGRDAETVESLVTDEIEDKIYEIEEIKEVRSVSRLGLSFISVRLRDDVDDVEPVWARIRDKLDDAQVNLPAGAGEPDFIELDFKAFAMIVAVKWDRADSPNYAVLRRQAEEVKKKIKMISGTEDVDLFGEPDEEILIELDNNAIIALNLTSAQVAAQIAASDAKTSAGLLRTDASKLILELDTQIEQLDQIAGIPIRSGDDGQVVRLGDIARVEKKIADPPSSLAIIDGQPGIGIGIFVRPNTRIDHWASRINQELGEIKSQLPTGLELRTIYEQNEYVSSRLSSLMRNLMLGALAITLVILVMMGWRNALIVVCALPLSACLVLAGMRMLEIPIHQMSVTGLIIALGLLIDNAIVMVDEVTFKMKNGKSASAAIKSCVHHLFVPLLGSTLTTALAFGPIALMPGPAGEFVGSIAISVILAIFSSFLLAMTIVPTLTGIFSPFRNLHLEHGNRFSDEVSQKTNWWLAGVSSERLRKIYERSLEIAFQRPWIGLAIGMAFPILGFIQARHLPEQFFPPADRDQIQIELELPAQSSLQQTLAVTAEIRAEFLQEERVQSVDWFLGESAPSFYYNLIPRRQNHPQCAQALVSLDSSENLPALIHRLQAIVDRKFPQARALVRQLEQGPPFDAPLEVRLFGPDLDELRRLGDEVRMIMVNTPGVIHTRNDLNEVAPKLSLQVDQEQAKLAGLNSIEIARQMNDALEGVVGGTMLEVTEELPLRVRVANRQRADLEEILSLQFLPSPQDQLMTQVSLPNEGFPGIPLSALANVKLQPESATITHLSNRRMNEIQAFIPAGILPAEVLVPFKKRLDESDFELPPGYYLAFGGETAKRDEAITNLMSQVGILLVLMVATLVLSFGSFRMASLVGMVAALSVGLGMGALWLYGFPFGFMAIVGTMGLIGVAINDTIVVLAAIRGDELAKTGDVEAVRKVVTRATRHILSTSLTTMAGFMPLILGGGGFWPPLAITIAGGVGGATILALYFTPAAYILLMCRKRNKALIELGRSLVGGLPSKVANPTTPSN